MASDGGSADVPSAYVRSTLEIAIEKTFSRCALKCGRDVRAPSELVMIFLCKFVKWRVKKEAATLSCLLPKG